MAETNTLDATRRLTTQRLNSLLQEVKHSLEGKPNEEGASGYVTVNLK